MGFFKKVFGDAADELKKSIEDSKNEMRKSLEDMKRSAMADFGIGGTSSRMADDDDDDEPRIIIGKFSNGVLDIRDDIEELDDESLEDYKNVKMIIFPRGLKKLGSDVICDQSKLEELDFSFVTELKEIPDDFISGTTRIKEFIVPQGVKNLGDGFVGECKAGTKIVIPNTVEKMGYINGENNNDLIVYLFAPKLKIEDAEEDIKTLYVLPEYYGYYAKQLKECDSEARLREMPEDMMNVYANSFASALAGKPAEKPAKKTKGKESAKIEDSTAPTPLDGLVQRIKEQLQSLSLTSFVLYGSDYEGDKEYEEIEQLADDGKLESSSEYIIHSYDVDDGETSVYVKLRKITLVDDIVVFNSEEEYEDMNGDIDIRAKYENQTIGNLLKIWGKDSVENGLTNILNHYLNNKTLIELNGGSEAVVVKTEPIAEPVPEPELIPEPKPEPQIATTSKVLTTNEKRYEIRDFKRKKMDDLRKARDAKDQNKTIENVNRWKQIIADIQVIDNALKGGARTLDELKESVKQNESLVAEINEFLGISDPKPDPKPEPIIVSEPVNSVYKGLFSERLEALISSALQDGVLTDQEIAVLKKRAEKEGEDWDEVEMIVNSRLAEIQKEKGIQISEPHDVQVNRKRPMELNNIERALVFVSYKSCEEADYAFLFLVDNNKLYATNENYNTPEIPSCDYFEEIDDFDCWIENISDEYKSFKQLSESLVEEFTDARLEEFEGDTSALAIDSKYTITIFVGDEKVYEETITCR
jgi:hypothetical protein